MAKKLLIIGEAFFPEDFIINDLAQEWSSKGYQIEVLTRTPSYPYGKTFNGYKNRIYQKSFFGDIPVHRVMVIPGYQKNQIIKILNYLSFVFFASIVGVFIGRKFDRVFVYQTGPLTVAIPGSVIKLLYKTQMTIWTQDLWPDTVYAYGFKKTKLLGAVLNRLVSFVYNNSDSIAVSCRGFSPKLSSYLTSPKSIHWVPNWPLIDSKSENAVSLPGTFNFTFAGNIGKVQNLDNVLKGFKTVAEKFPYAWLNLIGDGSAVEELQELVKKHGISNVNFVGRRPLEEMPDFFEASNVLLISLVDAPIYEIMIPSKFQTYLNYEKPIFAVMKGEVPSMIEDYLLGFSASCNEVDEIRLGFERFLKSSAEELNSMGLASKKLLEESFERKINIQKLTDLAFE
ncbi:glycosyltransferase family 4 protein [Algoriphagus sp. A40]|uniref:glycosyltransferase family 4 protein n=1 Tax=Algoriphagus sp. A40 TaxID=1945863 RepID=UPI000984C229|nr:glycosyltransferase family 4 protein [Algoriphagus sp. A40]OOG67952.1 glycosyltransferase WbuB [Algoriphagus sp. A40]